MRHKLVFITFLLSAIIPRWSQAEGTRELQPVSNEEVHLYTSTSTVGSSYGPFATPGVDEPYRLWVSIAATGERILFGFRKNSASSGVSVCIRNSSDAIVFPSTAIPTSGTGYISTYEQAVAGPNVISSSGYEPFIYTATAPGDYYIEFSTGTEIKYFDITVVNATNTEKRGRLWSKNWQLYTGDTDTPFSGKMYPYTDDQITTEIDFNGMAPARFTVACNPTGCSNTGNFIEDRKSVQGSYTYPAYKIFVNNPDEDLFPTGIVGGVDSVNVHNPCDGSVDIDLYVNKQGMAEITLNINPLPGIQDEDVVLNDTVYSGNATTIHWDGLNGLGESVPSGITFDIEVTYINGLTHLPMYDVEYSFTNEKNWPGFIVNLVRPAGDKPKVFWDDTSPTLTYPGTANLDGCINPVGCHFWGDAYGNQGNNATFNTWWFAVSTTLVPITILYRRSETIPYNYILCDGDSVNVFGQWTSQPGVFRDTLTNFMGCDSISEVTVTVKPGPSIDLGEDQLICHGESTTIGMVVPDVASYEWNTIPPQASPLGTDPTLTVNTTGTYQVKITANNGCIRTDQVLVTVRPPINQNLIRHD